MAIWLLLPTRRADIWKPRKGIAYGQPDMPAACWLEVSMLRKTSAAFVLFKALVCTENLIRR